METYLLKFSACLLVFWLVYVLILERQNTHHFKRFYLLGTLALSLAIPTLTITEYIEPIATNFETAEMLFPMELAIETAPIEEPSFFTLKNIFWLVYGFGVLLFFARFAINLMKMQRRIYKNESINERSFIYVLLQENLIPHSFFRYIFFNKIRYESHDIPKEVMLHEETHAKQLHSLDIIILELLQIVFWFHPLIYILKHHIKLNHEFLADQAVLQQGSDAKTYQNILLQFSSPDDYRDTQDISLSSAINYSSIKKRFTIMKTQTSKTRIWLSTVLVLPIIAILFYSFSTKEYVEKETTKTSEVVQMGKLTQTEDNIEAKSKANNELYELEKNQEQATAKQVAAYNAWAKKLSVSENKFIKKSELERFKSIYNIMSAEQKKSSESFPELPPPPPPPTKVPQYKNGKKKTLNEIIKETPKNIESGYELLENGESHYFTVHKGEKTFYNKDGYITDKKGIILPPPPPAPKNPSFLEYIEDMEKQSATFYLDNTKITANEAKTLAKNNSGKKTDMLTQKDSNGKYIVKLSRPKENKVQKSILPIVNGKTIESGKISLTLSEIKKLKLTIPNSGIISFKLKIPGIKTEFIDGNTITNETIKTLNTTKPNDVIIIFDFKDGKGSNISPVAIRIIEDIQLKEQNSILPLVNGKTIESGIIGLTLKEIKKLELTLLNGEIIAFKFKIPGIATESITGNKVTKTTLENLKSAKLDDVITLFDIKDGKDTKFLPVAIRIIE